MTKPVNLDKLKNTLSEIFFTNSEKTQDHQQNFEHFNYMNIWANLLLLQKCKRSAFLLNWEIFDDIETVSKLITAIKSVNREGHFSGIDNVIRLIKLDVGILVTDNKNLYKRGINELLDEYIKTKNKLCLELAVALFHFDTSCSLPGNDQKFILRIVADDGMLSLPLDLNLCTSSSKLQCVESEIKKLGQIFKHDIKLETFFDQRKKSKNAKVVSKKKFMYYQLPEFLDDNIENIFSLGVKYAENNEYSKLRQ